MILATISSRTRLRAITSSSASRSAAPNCSANSATRRISPRSFRNTAEALDIEPAEHRRGRLVEQVGATHVLEPVEQVVRTQALRFGAAEIVQHGAAVHHDQAIAEMRGL